MLNIYQCKILYRINYLYNITISMSDNETIDKSTISGNVPSLDAFLLNIKLITNQNSSVITFDRSILNVPKKDKESALSMKLTQLPYFSYKYEYPLSILRSFINYQDRINTFFNKNEFMRVISMGTAVISNEEEDVNKVIDNNVMVMLEILMPTRYPVKNNIHASHDYLMKSHEHAKAFYFDQYYSYKYIHFNMNNELKTIKKVIYFNDILNHPKYNELVESTIAFQNWANSKDGREIYLKEGKQSKDPKYNQKELIEDKNVVSLYESNTLTKFRYPNYSINNSELQRLIEQRGNYTKGDAKTQNQQIEKFHKVIDYGYQKYYLGAKKKRNEEYDKLLKGGFCDIDMRNVTNPNTPSKEIYLFVELHDMKIDETNVNEIDCDYKGDLLGNMFEKMIKGIRDDNRVINTGINVKSNVNFNKAISNNPSKFEKDNVKKEENIDADKMQSINDLILSYAQSNRMYRGKAGKTKADKMLDLLSIIEKSLNSVLADSYQSEYRLPDYRDLSDIVKIITKNKLKPKERNNDFCKDFVKILPDWSKEINNFNPLKINEKLQENLNRLLGNVRIEMQQEETKISNETNNPTAKKTEIIAKSRYHINVYTFYLYVAESILKANLDEIMGTNVKKGLEENEKKQDDKKDVKKGGISTKKKNKSKYTNKRKTMKK